MHNYSDKEEMKTAVEAHFERNAKAYFFNRITLLLKLCSALMSEKITLKNKI